MSNKLDFTIAVAQMQPRSGDVLHNVGHMRYLIAQAKKAGTKMIVFPELCTSGYMLGDRWEYDAFINEIDRANMEICAASDGIVVVWGSVVSDHSHIGEDGRLRKYNAALVAQEGQFVAGPRDGFVPKTNLPKYRIFDDARHFYPAAKLAEELNVHIGDLLRPFKVLIDGKQVSVAVAICEDLWEDEYNIKISRIYARYRPNLLVDISQSPWTTEKWRARERMLAKRAKDASCPILYVNAVGLQNNTKNLVWFDGNSALVQANGTFSWRAPPHQAGLYMCNPTYEDGESVRTHHHPDGIAEIYHALIAAKRAFFEPFPRVVVGLSGGIDSAVSAALTVDAVGPGKVLAVNMPTEYNSQTTKDLAEECARSLGIEYRVVPIQRLYAEHLVQLQLAGHPADRVPMLVKENIQARIRGSVLAMLAAAEGGVFTCNGNKTEVALNYFTLYGDGAGACAFLADLWKGQVYELARYINERAGRELIPQGIVDIVPSAELSAEQNVDEGKGDPIFYPYHDQLLKMFVERRWTPTEVLEALMSRNRLVAALGVDAVRTMHAELTSREAIVENLEWVWRSYNKEFKRHQLPPTFIASRRAFGFDRRDTIAEGYFTAEYHRLKEAYLKWAT